MILKIIPWKMKKNIQWLFGQLLINRNFLKIFMIKIIFIDKSLQKIYKTFKDYTMIPKEIYLANLELVRKNNSIRGAVVECGTWRGGMIAGIAKILSSQDRKYFLFDSFEGLPRAEEIDGESARKWQSETDAPQYYNNCKTEKHFADQAMKASGAANYSITKGWFNETLPLFDKKEKIAILRLDADWYKPTQQCLENLFDNVVKGGIIIIDDYYVWDGCTRAVHDFLSKRKLSDKIYQYNNTVSYIIKRDDAN
jgi:O-methyltransferase